MDFAGGAESHNSMRLAFFRAHFETAPGARPSGRFKIRGAETKRTACGLPDDEAA